MVKKNKIINIHFKSTNKKKLVISFINYSNNKTIFQFSLRMLRIKNFKLNLLKIIIFKTKKILKIYKIDKVNLYFDYSTNLLGYNFLDFPYIIKKFNIKNISANFNKSHNGCRIVK